MKEDKATELLRRLMRDFPLYECLDLYHGKTDQHPDDKPCPAEARLDQTRREVVEYLKERDNVR